MKAAGLVLLTVFGLGRLPFAPGTWASAATAAFAMGLTCSGASAAAINTALLIIAAFFGGACILFGRQAEEHYGRTDPQVIVADEVAGQGIALLCLPWRASGDPRSWLWNAALAATSLVAFRIFDILKPPPLRTIQRAPHGWGILLDDILAGVVSLVAGQLAARLLWTGVFSLPGR